MFSTDYRSAKAFCDQNRINTAKQLDGSSDTTDSLPRSYKINNLNIDEHNDEQIKIFKNQRLNALNEATKQNGAAPLTQKSGRQPNPLGVAKRNSPCVWLTSQL